MELPISYELINFTPVVTIIFLVVFMRTNDMFEKNISTMFNLAIVITVLMLVIGNVRLGTHNDFRWIFFVEVFIRVAVLYAISLIMLRRLIFKNKKWIVPIPVALAFIFMIVGIFVYDGMLVWIDRMEWLYIVVMLGVVGYDIYVQIYDEAVIAAAMAFMLGYSIAYDARTDGWYNIFWAADTLSLAFYYMYFHAQSFKRDVLTGVLNRRCFYADAKRFELKISAIMSIDLNNLKTLNDTMGHAEGDKAIVTMTNNVRRALPRDCYMYRTGGDEFMAIFTKTDMETVRITKEIVKDNMAKTPYSCAIGIAEYRDNDTLDEVCARADVAMYEDKIEMKKKLGGVVR